MFARNGYASSSMRDIAASVGIKSASLYNHFKNKDDILNCILDKAEERYFDRRKKIDVPDNLDKSVVQKYNDMTKDKFLSICDELFEFYVSDPFMSNLRKFLCIEQFADAKLSALYKRYFFDNIIGSQTDAFKTFIEKGKFKNADPKIIALHFYSPIFLLFSEYDNGMSMEEALKLLHAHATQFSKNYNLLYDENKGF